MNNLRIIIALLGVIGVIALPPWVPVLCVIALSVRFRAWEAIFIGALMDFAWLPSSAFHSLPLFTIAALLIVWGFEPLRAEFLVSQ
jgi:hypothetical protein